MAASVRPYPTEMPAEVWDIIWQAMRGNIADKNHAIHVGYECAGVALGKAFPDGSPLIGSLKTGDRAAAEKAIEGMAKGLKMAHEDCPWCAIVQRLFELLQLLTG